MITKSITQTRAQLAELIKLAHTGEEIVIIKDSKPVATIVPITDADLSLRPLRLTDKQARKLHQLADASPKMTFPSAEAAVRFLKRRSRKAS